MAAERHDSGDVPTPLTIPTAGVNGTTAQDERHGTQVDGELRG